MNAGTLTWEHKLIDWAHEGLASQAAHIFLVRDEAALAAAYVRCEAITREHSRTFYLASSLLPSDKRRAARALYAFCRTSDDLVDCGQGGAMESLQAWRQCALSVLPCDNPVALAWADTRLRYRIPVRYAEQLIAGVARDVTTCRYGPFEELAAYCYGVASTVWLMAMHIIGYAGQQAIPFTHSPIHPLSHSA